MKNLYSSELRTYVYWLRLTNVPFVRVIKLRTNINDFKSILNIGLKFVFWLFWFENWFVKMNDAFIKFGLWIFDKLTRPCRIWFSSIRPYCTSLNNLLMIEQNRIIELIIELSMTYFIEWKLINVIMLSELKNFQPWKRCDFHRPLSCISKN